MCGTARGTLLLLKWGLLQMPCLVPKLLRLMGSCAEHPVIGAPFAMLSPLSRHSLAFLAKCPCVGDPLLLSCPPQRLMLQRSGGWGWGPVFHRFQRSHKITLLRCPSFKRSLKDGFPCCHHSHPTTHWQDRPNLAGTILCHSRVLRHRP